MACGGVNLWWQRQPKRDFSDSSRLDTGTTDPYTSSLVLGACFPTVKCDVLFKN
jgi:hypothetical protein